MISSPCGRPIILVSGEWGYHVHPKIRRGSPRARALNEGGVGTNWRFSTNKPPYLRNSARYNKGYHWTLTENRIHAFDWYQNLRHCLTLKWLGQQLCTLLYYTRASEPTSKICMEIDPYYHGQKCCPGIVVSSKISFMQIFVGVRWRMRVGWSKKAIFASFARHIFRTFTSKATIIILCYVVP